MTNRLTFDGGNDFVLAGVPVACDSAIVEAGLDFKISPTATLNLSYDGMLGGGVTDNGGKIRLSVTF